MEEQGGLETAILAVFRIPFWVMGPRPDVWPEDEEWVTPDQLRRGGPGFEVRMPGMDLEE